MFESQDSWTDLLEQLIGRGLHGVKLIISHENQGLVTSIRKLFSEVPRQRCTVHLMRNVMAKAPARLRARLGHELSAIFSASSEKEAKLRQKALRDGLGSELPDAMEVLERGFADATAFFSFPQPHWPRIRNTNGVERLNLEIKRRTRSVGSFPDKRSALRMVTAIVIQHTKRWQHQPFLMMSDNRTNKPKEVAITN